MPSAHKKPANIRKIKKKPVDSIQRTPHEGDRQPKNKRISGPQMEGIRPKLPFGLQQRIYFSAFRLKPSARLYYLLYANCYLIGSHAIRSVKRILVLIQEIFIWVFGRLLLGSVSRVASLFRRHVLNALSASLIQEANFFIKTTLELREGRRQLAVMTARAKAEGSSPQLQTMTKEQRRILGKTRRQLAFRLTTRLANYFGPAVAAVCLVVAFSQFFQYTVALSIQYDGKDLGYIENEKIFDVAANDIERRVISGDDPFYVDDAPLYKIALVKKSDVSEVTEFSDNLLSSIMGDQVDQACGIYLNGDFLLAVTEEKEIQDYMQSLLEPYLASNKDAEIGFLFNVEYRSGLYPIDSIRTYQQAVDKISSKKETSFSYTVAKKDTVAKVASKNGMTQEELLKLNPTISSKLIAGKKITIKKLEPFMQVKVVRVETYTEQINYETTIKKDSSQYEGYSYIRTKGKNGERKVTANVIYVDGIEIGREVLSSTITKQPRSEVKVVGTRETPKYAPSVSKYGVEVTGKFMCPVENGHINCGWLGYSGHRGIDLSAKVGTPVYAADGGTVQAVYKKSYGYGYHIIISHGNGYSTLYAHLSKIKVSVGDKVSKGQLIALSGNTGRTTGPHLHFEIRVNGVQVNPTPYIF